MTTCWDLNDAEACERRIAYLSKSAQKDLRSFGSPLLVIQCEAIEPRPSIVRAAYSCSEKEFVELTASSHIISDDVERDVVQDEVLRFLEA